MNIKKKKLCLESSETYTQFYFLDNLHVFNTSNLKGVGESHFIVDGQKVHGWLHASVQWILRAVASLFDEYSFKRYRKYVGSSKYFF